IWDLRAALRAEYRAPLVWTRRIHLSSDREISAGRSAVHAPLPFVLRGAPAWRLPAPDERARRSDVRVGAEVQSLRPLLKRPRASQREGNPSLLPRARLGVLPRQNRLVSGPPRKAAYNCPSLFIQVMPGSRGTRGLLCCPCIA